MVLTQVMLAELKVNKDVNIYRRIIMCPKHTPKERAKRTKQQSKRRASKARKTKR